MTENELQSKQVLEVNRIRNKKLRELQMLVLGYMQCEDVKKARETLNKWEMEVKGVSNESVNS